MVAPRWRKSRKNAAPSRPWTEAEDAKIIEITRIGLSSHLWGEALPDRAFGEIVDRRLALQEAGLCPTTKPI